MAVSAFTAMTDSHHEGDNFILGATETQLIYGGVL